MPLFKSEAVDVVSPKLELQRKSLRDLTETEKLMERVKVQSGSSLADLSKKHRVVLIVIKFFGCPICQELIEKVAERFVMMLYSNTVPVICHQQKPETAQKFFSSHKNPFVRSLLYCRIEKEDRDILGLYNAGISSHVLSLGRNMQEVLINGRHIKLPTDVPYPFTIFGFFVVEQSEIVKKVYIENFAKNWNLNLLMHDLKIYTTPLEVQDMNIFEDFITLYPEIEKKLIRRASQKLGEHLSEKMMFESSYHDLPLIKECYMILNDDKKRQYFKMFAKQEFSVESLAFYEDIITYKSVEKSEERLKLGKKIASKYLNERSEQEINTRRSIVLKIEESFKNNEAPLDVFHPLVKDLVFNTILDCFSRFVLSDDYETMNQESPTLRSVSIKV